MLLDPAGHQRWLHGWMSSWSEGGRRGRGAERRKLLEFRLQSFPLCVLSVTTVTRLKKQPLFGVNLFTFFLLLVIPAGPRARPASSC